MRGQSRTSKAIGHMKTVLFSRNNISEIEVVPSEETKKSSKLFRVLATGMLTTIAGMVSFDAYADYTVKRDFPEVVINMTPWNPDMSDITLDDIKDFTGLDNIALVSPGRQPVETDGVLKNYRFAVSENPHDSTDKSNLVLTSMEVSGPLAQHLNNANALREKGNPWTSPLSYASQKIFDLEKNCLIVMPDQESMPTFHDLLFDDSLPVKQKFETYLRQDPEDVNRKMVGVVLLHEAAHCLQKGWTQNFDVSMFFKDEHEQELHTLRNEIDADVKAFEYAKTIYNDDMFLKLILSNRALHQIKGIFFAATNEENLWESGPGITHATTSSGVRLIHENISSAPLTPEEIASAATELTHALQDGGFHWIYPDQFNDDYLGDMLQLMAAAAAEDKASPQMRKLVTDLMSVLDVYEPKWVNSHSLEFKRGKDGESIISFMKDGKKDSPRPGEPAIIVISPEGELVQKLAFDHGNNGRKATSDFLMHSLLFDIGLREKERTRQNNNESIQVSGLSP